MYIYAMLVIRVVTKYRMSDHKSSLKPETFMVANVISLQLYCERSEAIQDLRKNWIASSLRSSQRRSERINMQRKCLSRQPHEYK